MGLWTRMATSSLTTFDYAHTPLDLMIGGHSYYGTFKDMDPQTAQVWRGHCQEGGMKKRFPYYQDFFP